MLGPNGGGKTTLFRALLGDVPRRTGSVRIDGSIAYVPQTERYRLDFPVDALDVVLMGTYASVPWYRPLGRAAAGTVARRPRSGRHWAGNPGLDSASSPAVSVSAS